MTRKKRDLFRELFAGVRAMREHAEGKVELRTTRVNPSRTGPEAADNRRTSHGPRRGRRESQRREPPLHARPRCA
jgi:hypothetical protein